MRDGQDVFMSVTQMRCKASFRPSGHTERELLMDTQPTQKLTSVSDLQDDLQDLAEHLLALQ